VELQTQEMWQVFQQELLELILRLLPIHQRIVSVYQMDAR
jgi:hypothetical protein